MRKIALITRRRTRIRTRNKASSPVVGSSLSALWSPAKAWRLASLYTAVIMQPTPTWLYLYALAIFAEDLGDFPTAEKLEHRAITAAYFSGLFDKLIHEGSKLPRSATTDQPCTG